MGSRAPWEPEGTKDSESGGGRGSTGKAKQKRKLKRLESLPPASFAAFLAGIGKAGPSVTFQSVCSLSHSEMPDKRDHGMRSEELGSHPQDIPPTLTLFQASTVCAICRGLAVFTSLASAM